MHSFPIYDGAKIHLESCRPLLIRSDIENAEALALEVGEVSVCVGLGGRRCAGMVKLSGGIGGGWRSEGDWQVRSDGLSASSNNLCITPLSLIQSVVVGYR